LGVIVVGIAVAVGINLFAESATEKNREELVSAVQSLGVMAQQYYKTPAIMRGGGGKFKKWKIPKFYEDFEGGKIKIKVGKKGKEVTITATGKEKGMDNKKKVKIESKVKSTSMEIVILN